MKNHVILSVRLIRLKLDKQNVSELNHREKRKKMLHVVLIVFNTVGLLLFAVILHRYLDSISGELDWEARGAIEGGIFVGVFVGAMIGSALLYQRITVKL